jgi:glutamate racemase
MNIGFFDSGLGGLTILRAVSKALPDYDYYYYGDTANLPYGDKSEALIYEYSVAAMRHLFNNDCQLVIVACNTASVETVRRLQNTYLPAEFPDRNILGIVIPTIETLIDGNYDAGLLIGTKRTIESGKYQLELLHRIGEKISLRGLATPVLVPLIEDGQLDEAAEVAISYIDTNRREGEVIILGCTHYTILKDRLRAHYGKAVIIISQDEILPTKLKLYLDNHPEICSCIANTGKRHIHLTKLDARYDVLAAQFLGGAYIAED